MEADLIIKKIIRDSQGKNIILFSNYRTGSTAFATVLAHSTNRLCYYDPFSNEESGVDFIDTFNRSSAELCVIRVMPDHLEQATIHLTENFIKNSYLIHLDRDNLLDQICSYYIANAMQNWGQTKKQIADDFSI